MDDFLTAVLNSMPTQICVVDKTGQILAVNRAWERFALDNGAGSLMGTGAGANYLEICENATGLFCDGAHEVADGLRAVLEGRLPEFSYEYPCPSPVQQRWFMVKISPVHAPLHAAVILHIDLTAHRLEEKARASAQADNDITLQRRASSSDADDAMVARILELGRHLAGSHSAALTMWSADHSSLQVVMADERWRKYIGLTFIPSADCACRQALECGQPIFRTPASPVERASGARQKTTLDSRTAARPPFLRAHEAYVCLPVEIGEAGSGCLWLEFQADWTPALQDTLRAFAGLAAKALQADQRQALAGKDASYLNSLRTIDRAILKQITLPELLALILHQGMSELDMAAGDVILISRTGKPVLAAFEGLQRRERPLPEKLLEQLCLRLHYEPELAYSLPDDDRSKYLRQRGLRREKYQFTCVVPVYAGDRLLALLEFFHPSPYDMTPNRRGYLDALAGQTALALLHHGLIDSLEGKNNELEDAYEKTIAGWSRTLDLRDDITEGHSRRVTELAIELARRLGISESELVHIRRGALLHDIGKTGIPDQVLLKPGPLTLDEQRIMNNHPLYAYELLAPVSFLGPALDIPYCHHELWDGSGYPRGLHGEEIPLYARLFTVVDVYDSLVSTRHYRQALHPDQALEYIASQSGKKFDPCITQVFLEMMRAQSGDLHPG